MTTRFKFVNISLEDKMRININFVLDKKTEQKCLNVNKEFCNCCDDAGIDFSNGCRPHMTLLMGEIEDKDFDLVAKIVNEIKFCSVGKSFSVTNAYAKNNFIFVDAKDVESFVFDCNEILKKLGNKILPHKYLISNGTSVPHISLCFSETADLDEFARKIKPFDCVSLVKVVVSKTGKHGTCLVDECAKNVNCQ